MVTIPASVINAGFEGLAEIVELMTGEKTDPLYEFCANDLIIEDLIRDNFNAIAKAFSKKKNMIEKGIIFTVELNRGHIDIYKNSVIFTDHNKDRKIDGIWEYEWKDLFRLTEKDKEEYRR